MATMRMREALRDAMAEEMRRDEDVFVMGEDVAVFQGSFKVTEGLLDEFGEKRVRDTPDLRELDRGDGGRRRDGRHPADRRDHDRQLRAAGDGSDRQPRGRDPVHVRRPGARAAGDPDARRRRTPTRPDPLAQLRGALSPDPGPARRLSLHPGRWQGPAEGRHPRRQPRDLHRARDALRAPRRGPGERRRGRRLRRGRHPPRGIRRHHRRHPEDGGGRAAGRARPSPRSTASRQK